MEAMLGIPCAYHLDQRVPMVGVLSHAREDDDTLTPLSFHSLPLAVDTVCVIGRAICVHHLAFEKLTTAPQALRDFLDGLLPRIQRLQEDGQPSYGHNSQPSAEIYTTVPEIQHSQRGAPPFLKNTRRTAEQTTRMSLYTSAKAYFEISKVISQKACLTLPAVHARTRGKFQGHSLGRREGTQ